MAFSTAVISHQKKEKRIERYREGMGSNSRFAFDVKLFNSFA